MPMPLAELPDREDHPLDPHHVTKEFPGFEITEEIALKDNIAVYRAKRKSDNLEYAFYVNVLHLRFDIITRKCIFCSRNRKL